MKMRKINYYKNALFGAFLAASLFAGAGVANADFAVTFDRPAFENMAQVNDTTTLIGWTFTTDRELYVNRLGLWDWETDRVDEHNHFVGLWDNTGKLLTSVTINEPAAPAHPNTPFHMADITRYTLEAGKTYTVAAILGGDFYTYHTPTTLDPDSPTVPFTGLTFNNVTYLQDAFQYTDGFNFNNLGTFGTFSLGSGVNDPNTVIGGFGANFDAVPTPIPAAAWLLGSGLLGLVGIRRRNN